MCDKMLRLPSLPSVTVKNVEKEDAVKKKTTLSLAVSAKRQCAIWYGTTPVEISALVLVKVYCIEVH